MTFLPKINVSTGLLGFQSMGYSFKSLSCVPVSAR
jgi:hypothetical protein